MKRNQSSGVFAAIRGAAAGHKLLSAGTLLCAAASVLTSLLPPLLLGQIIDDLTGGTPLVFTAALLYFGSLALEGVLSSAQETLLEIFGQKMTHALRSELSAKLTRLPAAALSAQDPGEVWRSPAGRNSCPPCARKRRPAVHGTALSEHRPWARCRQPMCRWRGADGSRCRKCPGHSSCP